MAVSDDRKYTKAFVHTLLEGIKGKTLGEVDKSHQFARTEKSEKITGIAGDVIEQSVFGYERDSKQECDIMKTFPKGNLHLVDAFSDGLQITLHYGLSVIYDSYVVADGLQVAQIVG